jgi:Membrane protein involved in colicin uptake
VARHRSPGGRGTYPVPPANVPGRHSLDGGARTSVTELLRSASAVAVLDRPEEANTSSEADAETPLATIPPPRRSGIVRLPTPRPATEVIDLRHVDTPSTEELEALLLDLPADGPGPAGLVEPPSAPTAEPPAARPDQDSRARRISTIAMALTGGVMSVVAATVPADAIAGAGAAAALTAGSAESTAADGSVADATPAVDELPPVADVAAITSSITAAHQQVTEQVAAAEAGLEQARQKAEAEKKAAEEKAAQEKAAQEKAEAEKKRAAAVSALRDCGLNESGLGAVKPHVRTAAQLLGCRFGKPTMYGVGGRSGTSDHPGGKAVDFMVDRATGDALAACALRNKDALGITYVIWRQRINYGKGWQPMEDRGSVTANHYDHVHISFGNSGSATSLQGCG